MGTIQRLIVLICIFLLLVSCVGLEAKKEKSGSGSKIVFG